MILDFGIIFAPFAAVAVSYEAFFAKRFAEGIYLCERAGLQAPIGPQSREPWVFTAVFEYAPQITIVRARGGGPESIGHETNIALRYKVDAISFR